MDDFDFYPEKPILEEKQFNGGLSATVLSIIIFVITFLLFFSEELNFLVNILIVLTIHELGHFLMMKYFKYRNVKMLFVPLMGAFVQGTKDEYSQKETMMVVGAGPFPGVLLGIVFLFLSVKFHETWMVDLGLMFLLLNLLNLLPIDPLDGGQLFKSFIKGNYELFLLAFSFISSMILILGGLYLNNWILVIFGFFMGFRVRSMQKNYLIHKELNKRNISYFSSYKNLSNKNYIQIKEVLFEQSTALNKIKDMMPGDELDPVMAEQVNSVLVTPMHYDASLFLKITFLFFWILCLSLIFVLPFLYLSGTLSVDYFNWYFNEISFK
jgi:stage IV sporulation protein FB